VEQGKMLMAKWSASEMKVKFSKDQLLDRNLATMDKVSRLEEVQVVYRTLSHSFHCPMPVLAAVLGSNLREMVSKISTWHRLL
jgi:hypothetical protein